jgi:hypothetical protein
MSTATDAWVKRGRDEPKDSMTRRGGAVEMRAGGRGALKVDDEEDEVVWLKRDRFIIWSFQ